MQYGYGYGYYPPGPWSTNPIYYGAPIPQFPGPDNEWSRTLLQFPRDSSPQFTPPSAPVLKRLKYSESRFQDIASKFRESWLHTDRKLANIGFIYDCQVDETLWYDYREYSERVGNTQAPLWHGTSRKCTLGDDPSNAELCHNSDCSLCQIIKTGYKTGHARSSGLLGSGIYTTTVSSKAAKYATTSKKSKYNVVLYNIVAVGRRYNATGPMKNASSPPPGYNSVYGNPGVTSLGPGKRSLQFIETCIYDDNAIEPLYMVLFTEE
ncbi:hypothetical protein R3P38DRAFT_2828296 [Favolaschia claudopus]|uniref:PARP catalytic domain-containing protein n=1 Tax=Favolaschia claudopus TaxID=2862362 RepID=A0AAW0E9G4_9AGAR